MLSLLNKFFDSNEREIKKLEPIIKEINNLEKKLLKLSDQDFPARTENLKKRLAKGERLEDILPEAFALVREAARRTIGLRHFDVQLMAGIVLSEGKIAEQKTGEGKTLSAVPALYLHSLSGKGVHLVTVNDYLARRDAGWMGPIFHFLGISVSSIINDASFRFNPSHVNEEAGDYRLSHLEPVSRQEAYKADVVYGINSEFGFDYLRDNMAQDLAEIVQREYYFAVVDEVDSVLIDEARTPHIISAPDEEPSQKYYEYASIVAKLTPEVDYKIDEKLKTAHLTDHGIGKVEKLFGIEDIYEKDFDTVYHLEAALKARTLFHKEKDYIVKDNQVILVDEFTGRLMIGRRLSEGLHQAIEAKENVPIQRESRTLATVSLQNYFRMYEVLAGMTGTAVTEAEEFKKIYNLDVVVIPTHNPLVREDASDVVYKTGRAKFTAVVAEIENAHQKGRPVLVGTTSIEKNEIISQLLRRRGIKHEVLNAKNHLREAEIIAQAGKKDAVTVATNMAGRGVDIILGGETPKRIQNSESEAKNDKDYEKKLKEWQKAHDEVIKLGGLYVIGTERHESRRIDNQLRGRSGRQGDPGKSQFFVALDDEIMRLFGGEKIAGLMTRFNMPEDVPLTHPLVSRAIENAQVKVEGFNFDIRKQLVEYDDVLNKQREIIYKMRRRVLETANKKDASLRSDILVKIENTVRFLVEKSREFADLDHENKSEKQLTEDFATIIPFDEKSQTELQLNLAGMPDNEQKIEFLTKVARDMYEAKEKQVGQDMMRYAERVVMLSVIDNLWMVHLDAIDNLRQGIGLRGYAQRDPLVEYKNEAYNMFEQLIFAIDDEIVHRIYKIHIEQTTDLTPKHEHVFTNTPLSEVSVANTKALGNPKQSARIGRNDPCWCGATKSDGTPKKFKHCHYPVLADGSKD